MIGNINVMPVTATVAASRNTTFDLLRGLAILCVIGVHTAQSFPTHINYFDRILELGRFGVQLFFFVSALTMCYMWELRNGEANQVVKFYVRRFLRIAPLFWIAIPAYLWINGVDESHWSPKGVGLHQIVLTAMFLHGFRPDSINSVVPGGWSIAVEMTFYLIFPLLITQINNRAYFLYLAIVCYFLNVALINFAVINLMGFDLTNSVLLRDFLYLNFFNQAPVFLVGCYLYGFIGTNASIHIKKTGATFLMWIAVAMIVNNFLGLPLKSISFLVVIVSEFVFVLLVMRNRLKCTVLEKLGRNSYAIYLSHFAVISLVVAIYEMTTLSKDGFMAFVLGIVSVTVISYIFSMGSYRLLEKIFIVWLKS